MKDLNKNIFNQLGKLEKKMPHHSSRYKRAMWFADYAKHYGGKDALKYIWVYNNIILKDIEEGYIDHDLD